MLSHYLAKSSNLQTITQHHFFRSGHSYNVCDRKFGIIERNRKKAENIFVPNEWKNLIENSKTSHPKFIVTELTANDFFSCDNLLSEYYTNRKKKQQTTKR